jgi:hypothetical protein
MREVLRKQESHSSERQSMYACVSPRCVYEASTADAMKHMMAAAGAGQGTTITDTKASPAASASGLLGRKAAAARAEAGRAPTLSFVCPACGNAMRKKDGRAVMAAAANRMDSFDEQLRSSGITGLLQSLKTVALGANRPSDKLEEKRVTLRGSNKAGYSTLPGGGQTGSGGSGTLGSGVAAFVAGGNEGGVTQVVVQLAGGAGAAAASAPGRQEISADTRVDASSMPAFLQQSAFTGQVTQSVGFLRVDEKANDGAGAAAAAAGGAAKGTGLEAAAGQLAFFELLASMQLHDSAPAAVAGAPTSVNPCTQAAVAEETSGTAATAATAIAGDSDDEGWD